MKILIVGGTGLIGPHVVSRLSESGANVLLFNRRGLSIGNGCSAVKGDRRDTKALRNVFEEFCPDVGIDMIPFRREDASGFLEASRGICSSVICISSIDVYLAYGRLHRTEVGSIFEGQLSEDAPLRTKLSKEGSGYDKLGVEEILIDSCEMPLTILRFPMIYGPPDMRRVGSYVKRIIDQRAWIPIGSSFARWQVSRISNTNCAEAVALCALSERQGVSIYNVAEEICLSEREWIEKIGHILNWPGRVIEMEDRVFPAPFDIDTRQDMNISSLRIRNELSYREIESPDEALTKAVRWAEEELRSGRKQETIDYSKEDEIVNQSGGSKVSHVI